MSNKYYLFLFFAVLTLKLLAIFSTNFDLFGDEAQYWLWSKDLDYGYYSKPPLLAWIVGFFTFFAGNSFYAIKLIPFFVYLLSSYVIYLLVLELYNDKKLAAITSISFYFIPVVTVSSFLLSTDVILIFFWSLSLLFLLRAIKSPLIINFLMLGIFLGLGFLSKYAAIYFLLSLIILILFDCNTKKIFFKNLTNLAVFVFSFLLVLLPNIIWNSNNSWITLSHTSDNIKISFINLNLLQGVEFVLIQGLMLGPIVFLTFFVFFKKIVFNFQTKFLLVFSLPTFVIVLIESILVRANANWAAVALIAFFILIVNLVYKHSTKALLINNIFNICFCFIFYILIAKSTQISFFDRINGISSFAAILEKEHLNDKKYLVIKDRLLYANLRYIFKKSNINILVPHNPKDNIKSHFELTAPLPPSFEEGFLLLGRPENLSYLENKINIIKITELNVLFKKEPIEIYEISF